MFEVNYELRIGAKRINEPETVFDATRGNRL